MRAQARSVRIGALGAMVALALSLGVSPAHADDPTPGPTGPYRTTHVPPTTVPGTPDEPWPAAPELGPTQPAPEAQGRTEAETLDDSATASITGRLVVPAGVDPTALEVTSSQGIYGVVAADGSFTISHLRSGDDRVQVRHGGADLAPVVYPHPTTWAYIPVVEGQVTAGVEIEVPRGGTFAGTVTGPDGPVAGARVTASCAWLGLFYTETDAQGGYRLDGMPAEPCRLRFDAPGELNLASPSQDGGLENAGGPALVVQAGEVRTVDQVFVPSAVLAGRVTGPDGMPVTAHVRVAGPQSGGWNITDTDGRFTIDSHLLAGDYTIWFSEVNDELGSEYFGGGVTREEATVVTLGTGEVRSDIDAQLDAVAQARVVLTGPDGEPAGSVSVERVGAGATPGGMSRSALWTGSDGSTPLYSYRAGSSRLAFARDSASTPYVAQFYSASGTTSATAAEATEVAFPANEVVVLHAQLRTGASITGTVIPPVGGSAISKTVIAFSDDESLPSRIGGTDAAGNYTIRGLLPGDYFVAVEGEGVDLEGLFHGTGTKPAEPNVTVSGVATTSGIDISARTRFADVAPSAPFAADIEWLGAQGITQGSVLADGSRVFDSAGPVRREAMAAFLYRAAGSPVFTAPVTSPFSDVATTAPFYKEISWLASKGISTGTDVGGGKKEFRPAEAVTREAMAAFLYRFKGSPAFTPPATPPFQDVAAGAPFAKEIAWLASVGVSAGTNVGGGVKEFRPKESVRREAMAAFLHRAAGVPGAVG